MPSTIPTAQDSNGNTLAHGDYVSLRRIAEQQSKASSLAFGTVCSAPIGEGDPPEGIVWVKINEVKNIGMNYLFSNGVQKGMRSIIILLISITDSIVQLYVTALYRSLHTRTSKTTRKY